LKTKKINLYKITKSIIEIDDENKWGGKSGKRNVESFGIKTITKSMTSTSTKSIGPKNGQITFTGKMILITAKKELLKLMKLTALKKNNYNNYCK